MNVSEIDVHAVPDGAFLLDVREEDEWLAGHAPEAVHIPLSELHDRADDVPGDQQVYVVCKVGGRSAHAAAWLNGLGRRAVNISGGMDAWQAAGLPMTSETGGEPFVA
ncbi:rhodanese-like domain-containing protein [Actinobacteria bacterium YIM 96077]|uniref:Rhodanese-like domain-containing protein n=1 Tax=Phytoactinopolyspora halophila TaxID=1981511 RepID=A0A329QYU6_9ACTN|nr:rhodanese-like domain-containing protein [Phytoactinopolyspora halophila]AYY13268.1 rhodanese-like domain-containing protein [Actinobacteria bacterium YIM 96077]RAW17495.1 rhodanese-like domain-containing protein [Phytoactinopolyspora halophila]